MGKVCYQRPNFNPKKGRQFGRREADLRDDLLLGARGIELQLFEAVPVETVEGFRPEVVV